MNSKELARAAARLLDKRKGEDILIIDIAEKSSFADYFILASGGSERQIGSLADDVEEALAKDGLPVKNIEGTKESGWILMDYGDMIINILTREMRERYNIEKVWVDCDKLPLEE
ncbi:MAG: ribosome silencing factor [Anaerovoracaceae bacterium]|jgi:ribosome-associated protein